MCPLPLQILANRTEKRLVGTTKGNFFSSTNFSTEDQAKGAEPKRVKTAAQKTAPGGDRLFWAEALPGAVAAHDAQVGNACHNLSSTLCSELTSVFVAAN